MRNSRISEKDLADTVMGLLQEKLPSSWIATEKMQARVGEFVADAVIEIQAPDGTRKSLLVEAKSQITPGGAEDLIARLRRNVSNLPQPSRPGLIVAAPYLSPNTRQLLAEQGVGYIDMTGNMRIVVDIPALLLETEGARWNPWTKNRPLRSLKGPTAGRIVRGLVDFTPPYTLTRLGGLAKADVASVYRVVSFLEPEGLVGRRPRSPIEEVDWPGLLRRWAQDYSLMDSNLAATFLEPRGAGEVVGKLKEADFRYAITGPMATLTVAPSVPGRLAIAYVDSVSSSAGRLQLRPMEAGANVILAEPYDDVVYERTWEADPGGVRCAALSQVAVDLLTGPGRSPVGGDELIRWMQDNEGKWREPGSY